MAERTGHAKLDELLDEFARGWYARPDGSREEYSTDPEGDELWMHHEGITSDQIARWEPDAWGPGSGSYPYTKDPVEQLRKWSDGQCDHAARSLVQFLRSKGIEAYNNCGDEDPTGYFPTDGKLTAIGYTDCPDPDPIFPEHSLCFVDMGDEDFSIDFTAGQYGYSEFPMVQRMSCSVGGEIEWERDWPMAPKLAALDQARSASSPAGAAPTRQVGR